MITAAPQKKKIRDCILYGNLFDHGDNLYNGKIARPRVLSPLFLTFLFALSNVKIEMKLWVNVVSFWSSLTFLKLFLATSSLRL